MKKSAFGPWLASRFSIALAAICTALLLGSGVARAGQVSASTKTLQVTQQGNLVTITAQIVAKNTGRLSAQGLTVTSNTGSVLVGDVAPNGGVATSKPYTFTVDTSKLGTRSWTVPVNFQYRSGGAAVVEPNVLGYSVGK